MSDSEPFIFFTIAMFKLFTSIHYDCNTHKPSQAWRLNHRRSLRCFLLSPPTGTGRVCALLSQTSETFGHECCNLGLKNGRLWIPIYEINRVIPIMSGKLWGISCDYGKAITDLRP